MVGKVGYVYQASNFIYAGYSDGEMYMKEKQKLMDECLIDLGFPRPNFKEEF